MYSHRQPRGVTHEPQVTADRSHHRALSSLLVGGAASAQSAGAYFSGSTQQTINPLQCIGGGGPYFSIGAYTGYFKANDNSYPKTGDTVHAKLMALPERFNTATAFDCQSHRRNLRPQPLNPTRGGQP